MSTMDMMVSGAMNVLRAVLSLREGDKVLIITDERKYRIGEAFMHGAINLGGEARLYMLPEDERPLRDVPSDLNFSGYNIILNIFEGIAEETPFRIKLAALEMRNGARVGHAPGITEDMMLHGPMNADYESIARVAFSLMKKLEGARYAYITAPGGTNIKINIEDRPFDTDVVIEKGKMGNLPAGEIWCAPVEDDANGVVVADGSIGDLGPVPSPITLVIENGVAVDVRGEDSEFVRRVEEVISVDDMARVIGEFGIGLNPNARITGNLLEDEKAGGTAHIALGNNIDMPNGRNNSKTHRDFLFMKPTIIIEYKNGEKIKIIENGEILVVKEGKQYL